jgi:hypothetical protein
MKKTVLEIYALAICFVTVVCFVIALGIAAYGIVGIANPGFTISSWVYAQHQTNDAFWNGPNAPRVHDGTDDKSKERPNEAELTKQREASYERALASERRDNLQSIAKSSIVMLIDMIVFFLHWLIARRERRSAA